MTRQIRLTPTADDVRIAQLAALAIGIHVLESALPSPIPGVKPGLANVITLAVFFLYGWRAAVWVSLLRVVVGSVILGTFLSPAFMLSLGGALASLAVLAIVTRLQFLGIGAVGASVLAALAHMAGQFFLAYSLFIPHDAILGLLPVLMTAALVFGVVSGVVAQHLLGKVKATS